MSTDIAERPTNVKGLLLEAPVYGPTDFAPEEFVTPQLFEEYTQMIAESIAEGRFSSEHLSTAAYLTVIFPERRGQIPTPTDFLENAQPYNDFDVASLRIFYPAEFSRESVLGSHGLQRLLIRKIKNDSNKANNILKSFILYPQNMPEILQIPGLEDELRIVMEQTRDSENMDTFLSFAAALKLLHPDKSIGLSQKDWEEIKSWLAGFRDGNHSPMLVRHTALAKIIAAQDVQMTPDGLKIITSPKHFQNQSTPLPQTIKY